MNGAIQSVDQLSTKNTDIGFEPGLSGVETTTKVKNKFYQFIFDPFPVDYIPFRIRL